MREWSVNDVRYWLKSIAIPDESAEWFYSEHWTGESVAIVDAPYLKSEEIPDLKSGDILRIIRRRDNVLEDEKQTEHAICPSAVAANTPDSVTTGTLPAASTPQQNSLISKGNGQVQSSDVDSCGEFGSSVSSEKLEYRRDDELPNTEGKQDQLTETSHLFVEEDLSTPNGLFQFAYQTLQFACACLNDRSNGTIHFGVESRRSGAPRPGTVVGTRLTKFDDYKKYLKSALLKCFTPEQHDIVLACVQDPTFIKVKGPGKDVDAYVVEVHVVPSYVSCRDEAFFVKLPLSKPSKGSGLTLEKPAVFRWNHDKPSRVAGDELASFMKSKGSLANKRKLQDQRQRQAESGITETLSKKLVRLLCHGEDGFVGESFPILMINKPDKHMDHSFLQKNMSFLSKIQWKAVFDFDAEGTMRTFFDSQEEREARVITTADDFDPESEQNVKYPGRLETLRDGIRSSNRCPWIFCNGHNDTRKDQLDPIAWNKEKRIGFRKAVDFFADEIPKGRAVIVHLLLSNDMNMTMEAAQDFHPMFPDQYMCVAENEDTWAPLKQELVRRNCESSETLDDHAVVGMSWKRVNQTIEMLSGPKQQGECRLPSSSGSYVTIKSSVLQRLEDLEVLGANQCENSEILEDAEALERHRLDTEEKFYRGGKADWWNFYFSDHVLRRRKQKLLHNAVTFELEGPSTDRNHVHTVKMFHEPGSGGTTTAMQTLWDFRKKYRCALVRKISKDTVSQILQLHSHDDSNPLPLLLLLDNADEEHATDLKIDVEVKSKRMTLDHPGKPKLTCVFLECARSTKGKVECITLKQELGAEEIEWFEKKNRLLEETHSETNGIHPKQLISFNIMRKNFDPEYIKTKVKEVIGDIDRVKEKTLLKYVALINAYEVGFDPLPTAAFDLLMNDGPIRPRGRYKTLPLWETQLSQAMRILINEVSNETIGYSRSLRMASPLLSKHVLTELRKQDGVEQSLSDVVLELFCHNYVFSQISHSKKALTDIVKIMLVRRERLPDGSPDGFIAPLIQTIYEDESPEKASIVIEQGYKLIEDAFIAQQIARLYIQEKNWQKAVEYAKLSTDQISNNSYLWDTYGRVYLLQVEQELENMKKCVARKRNDDDVGRIVEIAMQGIDKFQKGQKVNQMEPRFNEAGYINEVKLTMKLLDYLNKTGVFGDEEHMRKFLTDASVVPAGVVFLEDFNGQDYFTKLKKMHSDVRQTIVYLDDKNLQISHTMFRDRSQKNLEQLGSLKKKFFNYFVKPAAKNFARLSDNERCELRRCRLYGYESYALGNIFDCTKEDLLTMKKLVEENIDNPSCLNAEDLRIFVSVNLVLSVRFQHDESQKLYNSLSRYSCKLYDQRHKLPLMYLEAYLFYVMFNWPRNDVRQTRLLEDILPQWKEDFFRKYPKAKDANKSYRGRPTTKFFLANGKGMKSIFCYDRKQRGEEFWRDAEVIKKLQRFTGILVEDGFYVLLGHDEDERGSIKIQTSFPMIRHEHMWNKKVYFVVGFSWDGPKAFDVARENPADKRQRSTMDASQTSVSGW